LNQNHNICRPTVLNLKEIGSVFQALLLENTETNRLF